MDQKILIEKLDKIIAIIEASNRANLTTYIASICAILAVAIAFYSIYITIKNFKISIRNEKLEQMFTYIEDLSHIYSDLYSVYLSLRNYHDENDKTTRDNWLKEYQKRRKAFLTKIQIQTYLELVIKLEILARSYLSKSSQLKVLAFSRMYRDLLDCTVNMNWMSKEMFWDEGFPVTSRLNQYTDQLGNLLVDEIGISSGNKNFRKELKFYTEGTFKQDIGVKKRV